MVVSCVFVEIVFVRSTMGRYRYQRKREMKLRTVDVETGVEVLKQ